VFGKPTLRGNIRENIRENVRNNIIETKEDIENVKHDKPRKKVDSL